MIINKITNSITLDKIMSFGADEKITGPVSSNKITDPRCDNITCNFIF